MICLKNRTFAVYKTTYAPYKSRLRLLWFAWKIVPLRYTKQHFPPFGSPFHGCDLLEKSYLCGIQNNRQCSTVHGTAVVICLKNRTFAVYKTTKLWSTLVQNYVVICLKNRTFAVYKTTYGTFLKGSTPLWFAWKIVPLRYTKQLWNLFNVSSLCCDLLEKSYLCGIQNNHQRTHGIAPSVVICLKNRTFAVYKTTDKEMVCFLCLLWFAWKIVPLRYTKQLTLCNLLTNKLIQWFCWKIKWNRKAKSHSVRMGFFHIWQELFSLLRAHPSTLHDKAQVPVGKVYQYVHPCALKFVHHIKNPAIRDDVLLFYCYLCHAT